MASDGWPAASGEAGSRALRGRASCVLAAALLCVLMVATLVVAAVLRLADLGNRPMHCDEAVHAIKFGRLLEEDDYVYDPREYHGPSLNFLTLPVAWAVSAEKLTEITEAHLRLLPAVFGIGLVALVWLVRDELGRAAALWAALFAAVSPAMVFYSRYYIQEMLLVAFTFAAIVALWRYRRAATGPTARRSRAAWFRQAFWLVLLGFSIGMMHATKETCVIALFAIVVAAVVTMRRPRRSRKPELAGGKGQVARGKGQGARDTGASTATPDSPLPTPHSPPATRHSPLAFLLVVLVAAGTSALLFSSFLDNPRGVLDSYTTYFHYLGRASGEGSVGRHVYPADYYLRVLFWWQRPGEPVWTEAPVAALAVVGIVAGVLGRGLKPATVPMVRFLSVYTVLLTAIYSALPYKTPWCGLSFLHGMILLAGVGAAVLVRAVAYPGDASTPPASPIADGAGEHGRRCHSVCSRGDMLKHNLRFMVQGFRTLVVVVLLVGAVGYSTWQAHRASFVEYEDRDNPYVYAHTTDEVPMLVERIERIAAAHPAGREMPIQVICPEDDYWPLPWYLRGFRSVGWFGRTPRGPAAPLIVTQPEMEPRLVEYLYEEQPPGQRSLYVPVVQGPDRQGWALRPFVPLHVYARLDLWERLDESGTVGSCSARAALDAMTLSAHGDSEAGVPVPPVSAPASTPGDGAIASTAARRASTCLRVVSACCSSVLTRDPNACCTSQSR